jgi:NAD(P)-dependent dehydrogenase (short-subunit alcohol dehydrogenase family)
MTIEQWDHTISANLTSSFLVCRELLCHLHAATENVKDRAVIVLIGSTSGNMARRTMKVVQSAKTVESHVYRE